MLLQNFAAAGDYWGTKLQEAGKTKRAEWLKPF